MKRLCAAVASAALILPVLSGCSYFSPLRTSQYYTPADGMSVDLEAESIQVRNALIVVGEDEDRGAFAATVLNNGTEDRTVTFAFGQAQYDVDVAAGDTVMIGPDKDESYTLEGIAERPGELTPAFVYPGEGAANGVELQVPILGTDLPRYATMTPDEAVEEEEDDTELEELEASPTEEAPDEAEPEAEEATNEEADSTPEEEDPADE